MDNYEYILEENRKLKAENKKLKEILQSNGYQYFEDVTLDRNERLRIYMDYFKGRTDVYPYKYFNKKQNKYTFGAFECLNKFKNNCPITQGKRCSSDCPLYNPKGLGKEDIYAHLSQSQKGIGIYPLLPDNTCYFLAMDFDDDLWFDNLLSVYRSAKKHGISPIMEKSQSGEGGHLWIFFESPIKASLARELGDYLIHDAMTNNKHLSFNSFDRMFPNQDFVSGKGFGNFIALPLQCDALKKGNSTFINEYGQVIKKFYHHLLSTPKVSEETINNILNVKNNNLKSYFTFNEDLLPTSINKNIEIIEDSLLHISKKSLSSKDIQSIRKLASTYNPEFYEKQRLHLSVYNTPRVLSEFIEDDYTISIPRGLKSKLFTFVNQDLVTYIDNTEPSSPIDISFKGSLRPDQIIAEEFLMQEDVAILQAATGYGKTTIALHVMSQLKVNTLVIIQNKELLKQWKDKIDEFIKYPQSEKKKDHYIGEFSGSKKKLKGNIDIALIQSLANIDDFSILQKYGLVLIDECHHASSDTYRKVLKHLNAKYIYSFSATPQRKDKLDKIGYMYLGNIAYKTDEKEIIHNRAYEQILIPRITSFKTISIDKSFTEISNELYVNQKRNHLIIQDVIKEIKNEKNIIILTDRKEHIQILYNQLQYENYDIYTMSGKTSTKERNKIKDKLLNSQKYVLIATSQLIGEGFDLPSLNVMFITMPLSYKGRLSQYIGRLHRDYPDKTDVKVYDYVDNNIKMLQNSFQKRLRTYRQQGYKTLEKEEITSFDKVIFNKNNYEQFLHHKMQYAKKNIFIFVNDIKINRIQRLYSFLISLISNNIKIYICINKDYDIDTLSYLEGISTKVIHVNETVNGILIDEEELWASNSSYLGVQYDNLYYIRTSSDNIIEELKDDINTSLNS